MIEPNKNDGLPSYPEPLNGPADLPEPPRLSKIAGLFDATFWWILLSFLAIALAAFPMRGGESLMRLATGRALAEGVTPLGQEPFSYALKDKPWIHGAWLFDRFLYAGWLLDGGQGRFLVALKTAGFLLLGWGVLAKAGRGRVRQLIGPMLAAAVLIAASGQADLGPHVATLFCMASLLFFMTIFDDRFDSSPASKWTYLLFFLFFMLWANLDGGFLYGLAAVLVWAAGELLSGKKKCWEKSCMLFSAVAGAMVNPFFHRVFQFPETLGLFEGVDELKKDGRVYLQHLGSFLDWVTASWNQTFLPFPALVGMSLMVVALVCIGTTFFKSGEKKLLWRLLVLVGFLLLGLARFRLVGLGATVAGIFLAGHFRAWSLQSASEATGRPWLARVAGAGALFGLVFVALFTDYLRPSGRTSREFGWGFVWSEGLRDLAQSVALKAADGAKTVPLEQRERMLVVENGGEMAGYLLWFAPDYAQFLDARWSRCAPVLADYKSTCAKLSVTGSTGEEGQIPGLPEWRNALDKYRIKTVATNMLGESPGVAVAPRFSSLSDWQSPYLAGAGQVARVREPSERDSLRSNALVNEYLDQLVLEATRDRLDWKEGSLDLPVKFRPFWEFWLRKPPISGKSIEAEIRANLAGQYRRSDARVAQAILAVRQAHIAMAEQPDNPGCLLVTLQCLGQLSDALGVQQEGGVLPDLVELEMVTLAQRVIDLAGSLEDERSDRVRSARLVLYQVAMRRNFWDQMEEHGRALLEGSRLDLSNRGDEGLKRLEALEEQIQQIAKRKSEAEDRLANALERRRNETGGKEPPQFLKAVTALEMGLPLRAMSEMQAAGTTDQIRDNEQLQINFALLNLQLALQLGRVDEVRSFLAGAGKALLDRPDTIRLSHPGVLLPQLLNSRALQVENRGYPLYDWLLIQSQVASGRYREAVEGLEKLAFLKQELLKPALNQVGKVLVLNEGPFSIVTALSGGRDSFTLASQCLGASGMPGLARSLNPVVHELAGMSASIDANLLRQSGMIAEIEGVCGYFALVSGEVEKSRASLGRSLVQSVNLGYVVRALMRTSSAIHPVSPLLQEIATNLAEGVVPSWHNRLGWVRILNSLLDGKTQDKVRK